MNNPKQGSSSRLAWDAAARYLALALTSVGVTALLLGASCAGAPHGPAPFVLPAAIGDTLEQPLTLRPVAVQRGDSMINVLSVVMDVVLDTVVLPGTTGGTVLRAYRVVSANGVNYNITGFPGPTFAVSAGDSVRILLRNKLAADPYMHSCYPYPASTGNPPRDTFPNCFHGLNTTNIHYHGTHITPSGSGDNVLVEVAPGDSFQTAFRLPMNQSPGTHWYHPHKHGSVAMQVLNGMAGALLINGTGGLDSVMRSLNMKQQMIAVQQVDSALNLMYPGLTAVPLINGQLNPVIVMRQGEVQRWRMINENVSNTTTYAVLFGDVPGVVEPKLYDVARDGVTYDAMNYSSTTPDQALVVAPGNRLDMFVQAPQDTGLHVFNRVLTGRVRAENELPQGVLAATTQPLLTVYVIPNDGTVNTTLPATMPTLPRFLADLGPTADTSAFLLFNEQGPTGRANPRTFFLGTDSIPQQKFDPSGPPFITMPLGATQTWKVTNSSQNLNHPFHIHINPFQIMKVVYDSVQDAGNKSLYAQVNAAAARNKPLWFDTFPLPMANSSGQNGYIIIRQQYNDFTGQFVMHCHILGHEERGMMQLLEISATGRPTMGREAPHRH